MVEWQKSPFLWVFGPPKTMMDQHMAIMIHPSPEYLDVDLGRVAAEKSGAPGFFLDQPMIGDGCIAPM